MFLRMVWSILKSFYDCYLTAKVCAPSNNLFVFASLLLLFVLMVLCNAGSEKKKKTTLGNMSFITGPIHSPSLNWNMLSGV